LSQQDSLDLFPCPDCFNDCPPAIHIIWHNSNIDISGEFAHSV
jgi:hypothetical protein